MVTIEQLGKPTPGTIGAWYTEKSGEGYVTIRWQWPMTRGLEYVVYSHNKPMVVQSYPLETWYFKEGGKAVSFYNERCDHDSQGRI